MLLVSTALFRAKQQVTDLKAEIREYPKSFVAGMPVPDLPIVLATRPGAPESTLPDLCSAHRFLVAVFTTAHCKACEQVERAAQEEARTAGNVRLTVVDVNPREGTSHVGGATAARTTVPLLFTTLHVSAVPSILIADGSCRVVAGATGHEASLAAIDVIRPAHVP